MSLWARREQRAANLEALGVVLRSRGGLNGPSSVTTESALRHSAVWAACRIRADLVSTFPLDVYRKVAGVEVELPKPGVLDYPGGKFWPYLRWMWTNEFDVSRGGNAIGLIEERYSNGLPAKIVWQPLAKCSVFQRKDMPTHMYRIDGVEYTPDQVHHDLNYPVPGLPLGLSPVAMAAWEISGNNSMQQFAMDWFAGSAVPKARLRNTKKSLETSAENQEARRIKDRYEATVTTGGTFVHGVDWELSFMQAEANDMTWLEGRRFGLTEIARYIGVPADLLDAAITAPGSITYQSALQRNLQFLVMHLGPEVIRREWSLSSLLAQPRYVKMNVNGLLRMDPETQAKVVDMKLKNKTLTNDEARSLDERKPLTAAEIAQFEKLYGVPRTPPPAVGANAALEYVNPYSAVPYDREADHV